MDGRNIGELSDAVTPDAVSPAMTEPRNDCASARRTNAPPKNICCVGDDDQSIYGWRGAEVDNILRFEHDFPGAKVIRLERNYRSTGHILAAASHLIAHNEGRLGKTLRTEDVPGEKVHGHRRLGLRGRSPRHRRGDRAAAARRGAARPSARRDRHPGARLVPDARVRRPLRHARPALSRDRRPALLRARRNPRRARLSARDRLSRPTISPSSASSTCPSAASATPRVQMLHDHARKTPHPADRSRRALSSRPTS